MLDTEVSSGSVGGAAHTVYFFRASRLVAAAVPVAQPLCLRVCRAPFVFASAFGTVPHAHPLPGSSVDATFGEALLSWQLGSTLT